MILNALVERARRTPDLAAVSYDGQVFSYAWLAGQILEARRGAAPLARHAGRVAAIHLDLLDNWIVSLALRSLGLTTLAVPVLDFLPSFRALDFACLLTSAEHAPVL